MGVFDLPAPLLAWLDGGLGQIAPPTLRLIFWGLVGGAASMALYWLLSPQRELAGTKAEAAQARRSLDAYDGDFAEAWPLIRQGVRPRAAPAAARAVARAGRRGAGDLPVRLAELGLWLQLPRRAREHRRHAPRRASCRRSW